MQTLASFRSFDRPVQIALTNMLVNNIGFYMLIPFLAGYLANDLGLALWLVGLVIGIRTLSQQGMSLVGGSLADRIGCKPTIVAGSVLRTIACVLFGVVDTPLGMTLAAMLIGFGGALLSPAVRTYIAHAAGPRRVEAYALLEITMHTGSLLGPLVGSLLIGLDFRLVSLGAGVMFLLVTLLQFRYLPDQDIPLSSAGQPLLRSWAEPLANRSFVLFSASMLGFFFLYNQVYLGLPLEVRRLTGSDAGVGLLFAMLAVTGIAGQVPMTAWAQSRLHPPTAIAIGLLLMGLAFAPLLAAAAILPIGPDVAGRWLAALGIDSHEPFTQGLAFITNLAPLALCCCLLITGQMLATPFIAGQIATLSAGRLVGTYFGMYAVVQGVGAALGNLAGGAALDVGRSAGWPGLPWVLMMLVGLACSVGVVGLDRSGLLSRESQATPVSRSGSAPRQLPERG